MLAATSRPSRRAAGADAVAVPWGPTLCSRGRGDQLHDAAGKPVAPGEASSPGESLNGPRRRHPAAFPPPPGWLACRAGKGPLPTQAGSLLGPQTADMTRSVTRGEPGPGKETNELSRSRIHKTLASQLFFLIIPTTRGKAVNVFSFILIKIRYHLSVARLSL